MTLQCDTETYVLLMSGRLYPEVAMAASRLVVVGDQQAALTFTQAGSAVEVIYVEGTPAQGIDVTLARGDTLDLQLTQSDWLVGFYTDWSRRRRDRPIAFRHK